MFSARSFGNYDLAAALADLIDNSIAAKATTISLDCDFNDGSPIVRIVDNGQGMNADELVDAMRPASRDPREVRATDDLGRFGWGMKSASFSQCMELTVVSRQADVFSGARWDLENLGNWNMQILDDYECKSLAEDDLKSNNGTLLIWTKCDRLSEGETISSKNFNELISNTKDSLALTFHRFIAGSNGARLIKITLNGLKIESFDPFFAGHVATQILDEDYPIRGDAPVIIRPYILPHFGKLPSAEQQRLEGREGMVRNQGFYVYRNNRLIIYGTWFRLIRHGELGQLFRISVDIPNSLDSEWKITLDKSDAQLPAALRDRLREVVKKLKVRASAPYRRKPIRTNSIDKVNIWERMVSGGANTYRINRNHPFVEVIFEDTETSNKAESLIGLIEQSLPITSLGGDLSSRPNDLVSTDTNATDFRNFVEHALPGLFALVGGNADELLKHLKTTEPFKSNSSIVKEIINSTEWLNVKY